MKRVTLVLADGTVFRGTSFGYEGESIAETVFNTSMTGYQEIITDPSYCGQMVVMTYPHIGNYGVNSDDAESSKAHIKALIVRELCRVPSNWRSEESLDVYLKRNHVIGVEGVDTRALTRHIRLQGAMMGIISTVEHDVALLHKKLDGVPGMAGQDLVREVTTKKTYAFSDSGRFHVKVLDFGVKTNILRCLRDLGCRLEVLPAQTSVKDIMSDNPDGVFLSNGPGDPAAVTYAIATVKELIGKIPIFGICLGHQILGLASGGRTFKLKFGHRGANQPVLEKATSSIAITAQNHGFAVEQDSLDQDAVEITHVNLNDGTVEGFRHRHVPAFSVQYHPEASPGPHDAYYLFQKFIELMEHAEVQ
ncbi:MAG: glutamine-hydrolyzing carbamoyl-phosphate synthase small subunit [Chlamydiota bacterium]|nr:glutamine-hydrolyzing carbamoyl-phosphate synthase small subunit [Chlamydiota bacterium]